MFRIYCTVADWRRRAGKPDALTAADGDRARYVADTFALVHFELPLSGGSRVWRAMLFSPTGPSLYVIEGLDRDDVVAEARARWGHFNFSDEAAAFDNVFPHVGTPVIPSASTPVV